MKVREILTDGILDFFKKKDDRAPTEKYLPLTDEQRALIKANFPQSNVAMRYGGEDSAYVLPHNAHAYHGNMRIAFRNEQGKLMASIGHYDSPRAASDPNKSPVMHTDHSADSAEEMEKIKQL